MNKSTARFIIYALHALIFCLLMGWFSCSGKKSGEQDQANAQTEETTSPLEMPAPEIAENNSNGGDNSLAPAPMQPPKPAKLVIPPYSPNYYSKDNLNIPANITSQLKNCKAAAVIDVNRHAILWSTNEQTVRPIASLTKMMTILLLMEDLENPAKGITLDTKLKVSKTAAAIGGHQVWLDPRETFTVEEMMKCILIRSANDCAYLVGEYLAGGDENAFVKRMNSSAKAMGCNSLFYYNCHGLPEKSINKENQGTALELAYLAERLWQYPEVIRWTSTKEEYIRENSKPFQLINTNTLLRNCRGVCGMKTGMTNKAGYCLVATCNRENQRIITVVLGAPSSSTRDKLSKDLIEWAYSVE